MWFDSHCHLYKLVGDDLADTAVIDAARREGVDGMLVLGVDPATSATSAALARDHGAVWAGAAYHPSEVKGWDHSLIEGIDELLAGPEVVAVGETGLDFYRDTSYVEDQRRAFQAHVDLAKRRDRALVIHTRSSVDATVEVLEALGPPERLIFHCWSGNRDQLTRALALGAHVSFAGNVSFKKSEDLRERCREVPADRLLIETDSPYLAPEPNRGKRNHPANVRLVGEAVAAARGESAGQVAETTSANARVVLGLPST